MGRESKGVRKGGEREEEGGGEGVGEGGEKLERGRIGRKRGEEGETETFGKRGERQSKGREKKLLAGRGTGMMGRDIKLMF